ncbi:MAG: hypothetical protein ACXVCS_17645 [Bdellovibrionota bacterium]
MRYQRIVSGCLLLWAGPAVAYTPAIEQWYLNWKNPPAAPRAEAKYCQNINNLDAGNLEKIQSFCPTQVAPAKIYVKEAATLKNEKSPDSCAFQARQLQILIDEVGYQGEQCDTRAALATASKGNEISQGSNGGQTQDVGDASTMQNAQIPVRTACIEQLKKLSETAQTQKRKLEAQAPSFFNAVDAEENKIGHGENFPCAKVKLNLYSGGRVAQKTLTQMALDADKVVAKAAQAIANHQAKIQAVDSYNKKIDTTKKLLGQ